MFKIKYFQKEMDRKLRCDVLMVSSYLDKRRLQNLFKALSEENKVFDESLWAGQRQHLCFECAVPLQFSATEPKQQEQGSGTPPPAQLSWGTVGTWRSCLRDNGEDDSSVNTLIRHWLQTIQHKILALWREIGWTHLLPRPGKSWCAVHRWRV